MTDPLKDKEAQVRLFESIMDFIQERGEVTREQIALAFMAVPQAEMNTALSMLVGNDFLSKTMEISRYKIKRGLK